jgi:hypothetical protein
MNRTSKKRKAVRVRGPAALVATKVPHYSRGRSNNPYEENRMGVKWGDETIIYVGGGNVRVAFVGLLINGIKSMVNGHVIGKQYSRIKVLNLTE